MLTQTPVRSVLLIIAAICIACSSAQADDARSLARDFNEAMRNKLWPQAAQIGARLAELEPQGGAVSYNVACAHARAGDPKASAVWLVRCANEGWSGVRSLETDPDLETVRAEPDYARALEIVHANVQKRFDEYKAVVRRTKPLIVLPPGYRAGEPAPLIIALHGSGGRGEQMADVWHAPAARHGAILVCPDALRQLGDGYQWKFRDESEWLVLDLIERVSADHAIDRSRIVLAGFSQGANVSIDMGIKHPSAFAGVIPVAGHWEVDVSPLPTEKPADSPRFAMLIGDRDEGTDSYRQAKKLFPAAGFDTRVKIYAGLGHAFPSDTTRELDDALSYVLGTEKRNKR